MPVGISVSGSLSTTKIPPLPFNGRKTITFFHLNSARNRPHRHHQVTTTTEYTSKLVTVLKGALSTAGGPGAECLLLQTLGQAGLLPFHKGVAPHIEMGDAFRYWLLLAKKVEKAPLFPLEDFADLLTVMTPVAGKDPKFQNLTARVDELLSKRTSGFVAADKCRDRAVKYLEADQYIPAIKQFHSARVKWFAAETLKGSVLSMMTLARCYQELGLLFAGAYYALGAALVTFRSEDETVKRLFPAAVFLAADCYYGAGATLTYLQLMQGALFAHGGYTTNLAANDGHLAALINRLLPSRRCPPGPVGADSPTRTIFSPFVPPAGPRGSPSVMRRTSASPTAWRSRLRPGL